MTGPRSEVRDHKSGRVEMKFSVTALSSDRTEGDCDLAEKEVSQILSLTNLTLEQKSYCCRCGLHIFYQNVD